MTETSSQHWLHRYAVLTAVVALLPISMGALVTTLGAGMAFLDWPTSDGWFMLTYPWIGDFRSRPDKFAEHGHRLAGVLIGMFSTGLCIWTWTAEPRGWVRWLATSILLAVIGQGLLGGFRVIQDSRISALVHGQCASLIFSLICVFASVTSRRWMQVVREPIGKRSVSSGLKFLVFAAPLLLLMQSIAGSFVRHFGVALDEHLGGAVLVSIAVVAAMVAGWRTGHGWLKAAVVGLMVTLLLQLMLGAGAWVTRFGFPPAGYVAVQQAAEQILFRTAHSVVAMLVLMMSVQLAVRVLRLNWLGGGEFLSSEMLDAGTNCLEPCSAGGLR